MFIKVNKKWQFVLEILMVLFGTCIMGFGFSIFLEPNNISTGGFSGLAMCINALFNVCGLKGLPTSVIYLILNLGLYLYALRTLGKKFAIKALIGIVAFSLWVEVFSIVNIGVTYELLISAIYGGIMMGVGIGLVVRFGGSTGGSDMIACIVKKYRPKASMGGLIVIVDMVVIVMSLFVYSNGLQLLPYTIIALLLDMFFTDFVNEGYKQIRAYNIVTDKPEELSDAVMKKLARGCTVTHVSGMHTRSDKYIVICLVSRFQMGQLRHIIREIDPNAFVYITKVNDVIGNWSSVEDIQKETQGVDNAK